MTLKVKAYAKINLFLAVKGRRPDGYHDLDTVMQSVSLFDEVSVTLTDTDIQVTCSDGRLCGEENIAYKACKAFMAKTGRNFGVLVHINKNIPVAAGLGGGSTDAAAVLLLLNRLSGDLLSVDELIDVAAKLGADVPFFLIGGTAVAGGIGEILTPINTPEMHYVLIKEGEKQSTAAMYALLDNLSRPVEGDADNITAAIKSESITEIAECIFNSFEACWDMKNMLTPFKEYKHLAAFLSGSGPTVIALFADKTTAELCAKDLKNRGLNAFYAHSVPVGIEF